MKSSCLLVVLLLVGGPSLAAQAPRIRPLDPAASAAYERGHRQSERFRALVAELDASDLIVHIVTTAGLPASLAGTTRFVARLGPWRYVRIDLAPSLSPKLRVATLAHELQHACELARSGASSLTAVRRLYEAIGMDTGGEGRVFETSDAERVGRLVWTELGEGRLRARSVER